MTAAPAPGKALNQSALDGAQPIGATEITFDIADKASGTVRVSSCRGLPCASGDELVSLGFRVGNSSASAGEFSSIPATRRRYPDNEQKNRQRAVCAEKWPEAQAEQVAGLHVFSSQEGAETIPRSGVFFF